MQVARWGNDLALRLPDSLVQALNLNEGDDVEVRVMDERVLGIARDDARTSALQRLKALRKPLPPGWSFDREEERQR
ncbi:MAG: AbrB/MazE/SpoVT family DNA-binding domain-containing protein [Desulfobulbaceae bacterium]|jgi:antitoxin MazE|nr:AbrB/MazE/SpoVT family DNA-binding domain-containing protein [Desulfobulbaceae bacterium]